jgi:DNA-binding NtrC family response regulator
MKVIIVGRDTELMEPLAARLTEAGLTVVVAENANAAVTSLGKSNAHFVVADSVLLIEHNLAHELMKRSPLIRLVGFSAQPTLPGLIEALIAGLVDYFPRNPASLEAVTELIVSEGRRLARWRDLLLTDEPAAGNEGSAA